MSFNVSHYTFSSGISFLKKQTFLYLNLFSVFWFEREHLTSAAVGSSSDPLTCLRIMSVNFASSSHDILVPGVVRDSSITYFIIEAFNYETAGHIYLSFLALSLWAEGWSWAGGLEAGLV